MQSTTQNSHPSRGALWTGRVFTALAVVFLVFDAVVKLIQSPLAVEPTVQLGYQASQVFIIGVIQMACLVLFVFPRTSVLGAMLMTGYLGGAVATNLRAGTPAFNIAFPFIIGAMIWLGLLLRERRLLALLPLRTSTAS